MTAPPTGPVPEDVRLCLLGGFDLSVRGHPLSVPEAARRLISLLALRGASPRTTVAGMLWPEGDDGMALGRLRTTIWRANASVRGLVVSRVGRLELAPWLVIDVHVLIARASQVIAEGRVRPDDVDERDVAGIAAKELLPEWSDEWVVEEREYVRQIQLHALEAMAAAFMEKRWYSAALESAMRAVQMDPMRETAHRAVILVHLAESNVAEATRHYTKLRALLQRELGVSPSPDLDALLDRAVGVRARAHA